MGEYRDGKWVPTFGDDQFGVVESPTQLYDRTRKLEQQLCRVRAVLDELREDHRDSDTFDGGVMYAVRMVVAALSSKDSAVSREQSDQ